MFEKPSLYECQWRFLDLKNPGGEPKGVILIHVDDVITGGEGRPFDAALKNVRDSLPFRRWERRQCRFTGTNLTQNEDYSITSDQSHTAGEMRPVKIAKGAHDDSAATSEQLSASRGLLGNGIWHVGNTRIDLALGVSLGQQKVKPGMKVGDIRMVNQVSRRGKQFSDLSVTFHSIDPSEWCLLCHTDASLGNCDDRRTQAGYIISMARKGLLDGKVSPLSLLLWKSYRLPVVSNSTLLAESQSLLRGAGKMEWMVHRFGEAKGLRGKSNKLRVVEDDDGMKTDLDGWIQPQDCIVQNAIFTDCKSLYDHLTSRTTPSTGLADAKCGLVMTALREAINRNVCSLRWVPSALQLADCLTKLHECDLIRAICQGAGYQIQSEEGALALRAEAKRERLARGAARAESAQSKTKDSSSSSQVESS